MHDDIDVLVNTRRPLVLTLISSPYGKRPFQKKKKITIKYYGKREIGAEMNLAFSGFKS